MKQIIAKITGVSLLLLGTYSIAMEAPSSEESSNRLPSEITVTGPKLFRTLERQIREAENVMYGMFNDLNDDDFYDIHCGWEKRIDTNIRHWECRPEFLVRASTADAVSFHNSVTGFGTVHAPPVQAVITYEYPRLEEKMREVLTENPEFLNAVIDAYELRQELAEKKTRYFDD